MAIKARGASGYSQTVKVINDFGLEQRTRTSPTGKTSVRFTVSISGAPLPHDLNPRELGRKPALAMADWLRTRVKTIQASASLSTKASRESAARQFAAGDPRALARYSGGRMGAMPPNTQAGGRLFNDSGRFAAGITAVPAGKDGRPSAGEWTINVPANRWDPTTLTGPEGKRGMAALQGIYIRLVELVPEFNDPQMLVNIPSVRRAIEESGKDILRRNGDLRDKLQAARLKTFRTILDTFGQLANQGSGAGLGF